MATRTGTATDYLDLLLQLRNFLTNTSSPSSGLNYTAVRDTSVQSPTPSEYEIIFRGTGASSPENPFYFGIKTYSDTPSGYWNWELAGFTGFVDGSPEGSVTFANQPGVIGLANVRAYIPLQNSSMTYWFFANDRRVIMVVKTGTSYQFMYAGFLNPYATDTEYPYPLCIAGSTSNSLQKFNENSLEYSSVPHPGGPNSTLLSTFTTILAPIWIYWLDGTWKPCKHYYSSGGSEVNLFNTVHIYPMGPGTVTNIAVEDQHVNSSSYTFNSLFRANQAGGTPTARLSATPSGTFGLLPMFPLAFYLHRTTGAESNFIGELDSCFFVPGTSGVASEDTILDQNVSPQEQFIIFQNVHRTDDWMYYAVKDA